MIDFFQAGGFSMYMLLLTAVGVAVLAAARRQSASSILSRGAVLVVIEGLFGLASNLTAVSTGYARFPDHVAALGQGLGEAATAGLFAGVLALALWVAGLATGLRGSAAATA